MPDAEPDFVELLAAHWETLRRLELVSDERSLVFRTLDEPPKYVEIFTWVEGGFEKAHEHPEVLVIWEEMGRLLEERDPLPKWDFPHFTPASVGASQTSRRDRQIP